MGRKHTHPNYGELPPERQEEITALYAENHKIAFAACLKFIRLRRTAQYLKQDLEREAHIALWRAAEGFDKERGFTFSTYAYTVIAHHLSRELPRLRAPFHLPGYIADRATSLDKLPISVHLDTRCWNISSIIEIPDQTETDEQDIAFLLEAIDELPEFERTVILSTYGIGCKRIPLTILGRKLGCTRYEVADIRRKAIAKLKRLLS